jgi:flagellar hook-associated protein 3 FlgL
MINILNPLSTLIASQNSRRDVARLQVELQQASQEVSSGVRANVFADLGQTASIPMLLRAQMDQTDAFAQSNALLGNNMVTAADYIASLR